MIPPYFFRLNTSGNKLFCFEVKYLKHKQYLKFSFSIPENVADEGLQLPHYEAIIINANARLRKKCSTHASVIIGGQGVV
jgi:serine acetyltransferase